MAGVNQGGLAGPMGRMRVEHSQPLGSSPAPSNTAVCDTHNGPSRLPAGKTHKR